MRLIDLIKTIEIPDIIPNKIIRINSNDYFDYNIYPIGSLHKIIRIFFSLAEEYVYTISNKEFILLVGYKKKRAIYHHFGGIKKELILEDILLDIEQDESYLVLKYGKFLLEEII